MSKTFEELLELDLEIPSQIKSQYRIFKNKKLKVAMYDFADFAVLANSNQDIFHKFHLCDVYISAHGRTKNGEINIYNKKIYYYGPAKHILTSDSIIYYIDSTYGPPTEKPLAHVYNGMIHPYTRNALLKLKSGQLQPEFFTGVEKSLCFMADNYLTRYETDEEDVKGFRSALRSNDLAIIVVIKNPILLSDLLEQLDKYIGIFRSYSLSFCRGVTSGFLKKNKQLKHKISTNDIGRLSQIKVDVKEIQKCLLTQSTIKLMNTSDKFETETFYPPRLIKWLTIDINVEIENRLGYYKNRKSNFDTVDIFNRGYAKDQKIAAIKMLQKGLESDYHRRIYMLSPETKEILFNGTLGSAFKRIATKHMIDTRHKMFQILGFEL